MGRLGLGVLSFSETHGSSHPANAASKLAVPPATSPKRQCRLVKATYDGPCHCSRPWKGTTPPHHWGALLAEREDFIQEITPAGKPVWLSILLPAAEFATFLAHIERKLSFSFQRVAGARETAWWERPARPRHCVKLAALPGLRLQGSARMHPHWLPSWALLSAQQAVLS